MMGLFNKNAEAYKLDLKDIVKKQEEETASYYMGAGANGSIKFLINTKIGVTELIFTREKAIFLVEQFQYYIGEDDE